MGCSWQPLGQYINDPELGLDDERRSSLASPPSCGTNLHIDGEVYALPADNAQFGMYYNRTIFDAYDAAHPDDPDWLPRRDLDVG